MHGKKQYLVGWCMSVKFIKHKDKEIIYVDHRKDENDMEMIDTLKKAIKIEESIEGNYLLLANYENKFVSFQFMEVLQDAGKKLNRKERAKTALVGISGIKTMFLSGYIKLTGHKNIKTFDNEQDAKEWLVS